MQGKAKQTRKFAEVKRMLNPKDLRLYVLEMETNWSQTLSHVAAHRKVNQDKAKEKEQKEEAKAVQHV